MQWNVMSSKYVNNSMPSVAMHVCVRMYVRDVLLYARMKNNVMRCGRNVRYVCMYICKQVCTCKRMNMCEVSVSCIVVCHVMNVRT